MAMDNDTLMVHWSTQHSSNGAEFTPEELDISNVIHIQCPVPACHFKHLSINTVRSHWELEHRDHPDKFRVIQHTVNKALLEVNSGSQLYKSTGVLLSFIFQETTGGKRRRSSSESSQTTAAKKKKVD